MFGPCRVCQEKEKRVSTLEAEITFLRTMVRPPVNNSQISLVEYEADGVVSGMTDQIEIQTHSDKMSEEDAAILAERDLILSGNY